MNYFLLDIDNLLRLKYKITPENYSDYIDALYEKLEEVNGQLEQYKEIIRMESWSSDPSPDDLDDLMEELTNEIQDLKIEVINLTDELSELKRSIK